MPPDESISRGEVLAAIREVASGVASLREHVGDSFTAIRRELAEASVASERRLARLETAGETWYAQTWPNASRVVESLEGRVRAVELVAGLQDQVEDHEHRIAFLETWRWRVVGFVAGVSLVGGALGWILARALKL